MNRGRMSLEERRERRKQRKREQAEQLRPIRERHAENKRLLPESSMNKRTYEQRYRYLGEINQYAELPEEVDGLDIGQPEIERARIIHRHFKR